MFRAECFILRAPDGQLNIEDRCDLSVQVEGLVPACSLPVSWRMGIECGSLISFLYSLVHVHFGHAGDPASGNSSS